MALIAINWRPAERELRQFAGIWFPAFWALIAWLIWYNWALVLVPAVLIGLAVVVGITGLIRPMFVRPVFVAWMIVAFPIGWVISHLLMATVFYAIITPIGLLMRLFGYDPMRKRFDPNVTTYWEPHAADNNVPRYFRQY